MKHSSKILFTLLALAALTVFSRQVEAQTVTWGVTTGTWNVPANWLGGSVPGSGTNATIDSGTARLPTSAVTGAANVLTIGESGTGVMTVSGSGDMSDVTGILGDMAGSSGTATISSGTWNNSGTLTIGNSGVGTLTLNGSLLTLNTILGSQAGSVGTVTIGSGTFTTGGLQVGGGGAGSFTLGGGTVSNSGSATIGVLGSGTATINSGTWTNAGVLTVAQSGTGVLNLSGLGSLSSAGGVIGSGSGSNGTVMFDRGTWTVSGSLVIGGSGTGSLFSPGRGSLIVGGGSGTIVLGSGAGSLGTLHDEGGFISAGTVTSGSGTGIVDFDANVLTTFGMQITGDVSVAQTGSGVAAKTTLTGSDTYTGTTSVSSGTLTVNGSISNSPSVVNGGLLNGSGTTGNVTVNSGGTLAGTLHSGVVAVNAGGMISPGNSPGADVMTSLSLSGSATYAAQIAAPGGGSYTGPGNHPVGGTDYDQTTLTGTNNGVSETVLTLDPANSILRLNVTGVLPAGGVAATGGGYNPTGSNSTLDNYFILNLSDTPDVVSGKFLQATLDGLSFTTIDYSSGNLVGNSSVGTFTLGGDEWAISYAGDSGSNSTTGGNDVVLTALMAVPEPGSCALLALGALGMVMVRRRRKSEG